MKGKKNESFDPKAGEQKPEETAKVNGASGNVIYDAKTGEVKDTVEERAAEVAAADAEKKAPAELEGEAADLAWNIPEFEPRLETILGDMQDAFVKWIPTVPGLSEAWRKMSEDDQNNVIKHYGAVSHEALTKSVNLVASRGFPAYEVTLAKFTVDRANRSMDGKWLSGLDGDLYEDLRSDTTWMMVPRNSAIFYGSRRPIKSDKIGSLGLTEPVPMRKDEPAPPPPVDAKKTEPEYARAVELVRAENNPSPSFVQRKLNVGYNTAVKIVEQMEANGVVGPAHPVTHHREVLPIAGVVLAPTDPPPHPASGPGTPTDPDVMDAVGKGLEAAAAVDAKKAPEAAATTP